MLAPLVLCVMITGMSMRLKLFVGSWDTQLKVCIGIFCTKITHNIIIGSIPVRQAGFESGSGMIVLDDLDCSGSEGSLFDCPSDSPLLVHDCDHSEDAGVRCLCMSLFCCQGTVLPCMTSCACSNLH